MLIFGIANVWYPSTELIPYKMCRTLKNIGCRYIQQQRTTKSEYMRTEWTHDFVWILCLSAPFPSHIGSYTHIPSVLPLPSLLLSSVFCECSVVVGYSLQCMLLLFFFSLLLFALLSFLSYVHSSVRSFIRLKFCVRFTSFHTPSFAAFIRFSMLVLFLFSSVSFHFILFSFLSPFPSFCSCKLNVSVFC